MSRRPLDSSVESAQNVGAMPRSAFLAGNRSKQWASSRPVCVWDGALWSHEGQNYSMFDFSGKHYFRVEPGSAVLSNASAIWHDRAVLSWLSCEQNLNHFIGETLGPAHHAATADGERFDSTHPTSSPYLIIANAAQWPNPHPDGCVGNRFLWLLSLMPTQPRSVFLAKTHPGGEAVTRHRSSFFTHFPPSTMFDAVAVRSSPLHVPHCFRQVLVSTPMRCGKGTCGPSAIPAPFYRDMGQRGAEVGACSRGPGHTLLVQREGHRVIANEAETVRSLERAFGLPVVTAVLERKTVPEQMALSCGARVFVGAHGMGMEWAHFIDGAVGTGLVIELAWPGWPCHYTRRFRATGKWAFCLFATPLTLPQQFDLQSVRHNGRINRAKFVNVTLNTSLIDAIDPRTYLQHPSYRYRTLSNRLHWNNLSEPVRLAAAAICKAAAKRAAGSMPSKHHAFAFAHSTEPRVWSDAVQRLAHVKMCLSNAQDS